MNVKVECIFANFMSFSQTLYFCMESVTHEQKEIEQRARNLGDKCVFETSEETKHENHGAVCFCCLYALLQGLKLAASLWPNRIGILLQWQRNQPQLPLIQRP